MDERLRRLWGYYGVVGRAGQAAQPGACAVQLRMKNASTQQLMAVGVQLARRRGSALFIVNDRVDVACALGADGVHLGQTDVPVWGARLLAGAGLLVGVSTHSLGQAKAAVEAGADYLGFGPIFATRTKDNPDPVQGLAALAEVVAAVAPVPVVAIGGITPESAADVAATGAAAACAISSVNDAADPAAAARAINQAFATSGRRPPPGPP
jgi:thiamine-phosphate pyrophosphorylase